MFRFANIEALWLLLFVPVLLLLMIWDRARRRRRISSFGNPKAVGRLMPYASATRFVIKAVLYELALVCLIIAIARPQFGSQKTESQRKGAEIMLVLDISRSMMAEDVQPNRLERAKMEISKLVTQLKQDRIGLILFAGKAFVQLPITNDYSAAQMFLSQVNCNMISEQGTALGEAIGLAVNSFSPQEDMGKSIVIISDGENHEDDPVSAAKTAGELGIKIISVGIGSPEGSPIPEGGGGLKKDANGEIVITRLDEKTLSQIALTTGGVYMRANNFQASLGPVLDEIDKLEKAEFNQIVYTSHNEQFQIFLLGAIGLIFVGTILLDRRNPWFNTDRLFGAMNRK